MNHHGLTPEELKQRHAAEVAKSRTFETHGVSKQSARDYLDTHEGKLFRQRLIEADPSAPVPDIDDRAIKQLRSGRDLPRMEVINEPLVKAVPRGTQPTPYTPFFGKESDFLDEVAKGQRINNRFGLPIASEAPVYDIYRIDPKGPTEVFVSSVAPMSELDGEVTRTGGAMQYLVPNRRLFSEPVRVGSLGNDLTLHQQFVVDRGLGAPIAARGLTPGAGVALKGLGALSAAATAYESVRTYDRYELLQQQGNPLAAQSAVNHTLARVIGGWTVGTAGAVLGSGAGPGGTFAGGAAGGVLGERAGERFAARLDNARIYRQTDGDGVAWAFSGLVWERKGQADTTLDSIDNPKDTRIVASLEQARALNAQASYAAVV